MDFPKTLLALHVLQHDTATAKEEALQPLVPLHFCGSMTKQMLDQMCCNHCCHCMFCSMTDHLQEHMCSKPCCHCMFCCRQNIPLWWTPGTPPKSTIIEKFQGDINRNSIPASQCLQATQAMECLVCSKDASCHFDQNTSWMSNALPCKLSYQKWSIWAKKHSSVMDPWNTPKINNNRKVSGRH